MKREWIVVATSICLAGLAALMVTSLNMVRAYRLDRYCPERFAEKVRAVKVVTVVGTRPHFVKVSVLWREIREVHTEVLVHTGQHYDYNMSGGFFEQLRIPDPDYNLGVGSGPPGWQVGTMMMRLEEVLRAERPNLVLVIGDTNSSLAAALTAAKLMLPVAHIEAGLRSGNAEEAEEVNRRLIDSVARFYLCPTDQAAENLRREAQPQERMHVIGDILADAVCAYLPLARKESNVMHRLRLQQNRFVLVTAHKPLNVCQPRRLAAITQAISAIGELVVWPVHPRTWKALDQFGLLDSLRQESTVVLTDPLLYLDMLILEENCRALITDSSGLEREAFYLGKRTLILRPRTENLHVLDSGLGQLLDLDRTDVSEHLMGFLEPHSSMSRPAVSLPRGDGPCQRVRRFLDSLEKEAVL